MGKTIDKNDLVVIEAIHKIVDKGGDAKVKRKPDGTLKVVEVKFNTVIG